MYVCAFIIYMCIHVGALIRCIRACVGLSTHTHMCVGTYCCKLYIRLAHANKYMTYFGKEHLSLPLFISLSMCYEIYVPTLLSVYQLIYLTSNRPTWTLSAATLWTEQSGYHIYFYFSVALYLSIYPSICISFHISMYLCIYVSIIIIMHASGMHVR